MKVAVIGLGYWGPNLVRNLLALGEDVYIFDQVPGRAVALSQRFPECTIANSAESIFNDPAIEAVALAVPLQEHCTLVIRALRAGKHVFIEKPLCSTMAEADSISHHLNGQVLMTGHITQFSPGIRMLKSYVDRQVIGEPRCFAFTRTHLGPIYTGTDVLTEVAAHDVAILLSLTQELPRSLSARGVSRLGLPEPDAAYLVLNWQDGVLARIEVQWTSALRRRVITCEGTKGTLIFSIEADGEHLELHDQEDAFDALKNELKTSKIIELVRTSNIPLSHCEPLRTELAAFLYCIRTADQPETNIHFSRRVVGVLEAARTSMANGGKEVEIFW